jgi:predicted DNA-binding protein with PD1-like motif
MNMRTLGVVLAALAIFHSMINAQQLRTEISGIALCGDAVRTSHAVPDGYATSGQFERVVVLRFRYQADLLAGLEEMVKTEGIRNAVILAGIGSVRNYHVHVVGNRAIPAKNIFVRDTTAPADIAGMNGYVIDGRVHAHITMADGEKAFGGHLERGTNVFTFAIVTLGVFKEGVNLDRADDQTYR